jgi:tetratricopeptide (TPR) repeat protein
MSKRSRPSEKRNAEPEGIFTPRGGETGAETGAETQLPLLLCLLIIAGAVFYFTMGWMDNGLPLEDFPGNVAHVAELRQSIAREGHLSLWSSTWFNGQPRSMLFAKFLSAALPLALSFLGPVASIKVSLGLFHLLSGLAMFVLLGSMVRDRGIRTVGAVLYAVHPMAIVESAQRGHMEVAMFYAVVPLVFWMAHRAFSKESFADSMILGVFISVGLWINNEGSFVTYPFLLLFLLHALFVSGSEVRRSEAGDRFWPSFLPHARRKGLCLVVALAASLSLTAFFWIPAVMEHGLCNLFDPSYVQSAIREFSYGNILYAVNRDGALFSQMRDLSPEARRFGPYLYLGIIPLAFALLALLKRQERLGWTEYVWFGMAWGALALSFGAYSIVATLDTLLLSADVRSTLLSCFAVLFFVAIIAVFFFYRSIGRFLISRRPEMVFLAALLLLGALVPWFRALRSVVPFYREMRAPFWFFITPCVFATSVLAVRGMDWVRQAVPIKLRLPLVFVFLVLVVLDFRPYRKIFYENQAPQKTLFELSQTGERIATDDAWCRTLGVESYNPLADMITLFSRKPSAWSWLNWSALSGSANIVYDHVYPQLRDESPERRRDAALLAGLCNVKYFVDDLGEPPNLPQEGNEYLKPVYQSGRFAVYENGLFLPYVQFYPQSVAYVGPFDARAASIMAYCVSNNTLFQEVEPSELPKQQWGKYERVLWNLRSDEEGRPVRIPDSIPKERLVNILEKAPLSLSCGSLPKLRMEWGRESADRIRLRMAQDTLTTRPMTLLVSESWAPGWKARIDGSPAPVHKGNHAFLSVDLAPAQREVVFEYARPLYNKLGYLISAASLLVAGLLLARHFARKLSALETGKTGESPTGVPGEVPADWGIQRFLQRFAPARGKSELGATPVPRVDRDLTSLPSEGSTRAPWMNAWDWGLALAVVSAGLLLYTLTLTPTVTARDSGELVTAAATLGVPHPPGYPTYTVLGYVFSKLPFGPSVAWRVNLMTALFGALTAGGLMLVFRELGLARWTSLCAALAFLATRTLWSQSVVAEKYTPMAFANVVMLLSAMRYEKSRKTSHLYLTLFAAGLGITCHYMTQLLLVPLAAFLLMVDRKIIFSTRKMITSLVVVLLSLTPMLLPWLFAQKHAPVNWGNPDTFIRWLDHIRRIQYRELEFTEVVPFGDKFRFLANYLLELNRQVSPLGIALLIVGFRSIRARSKRLVILIPGCFFMNAVVLTVLLQFRYIPVNIMRVQVYYIPSYIAAWILIALGWREAVAWLAGKYKAIRRIQASIGRTALEAVPFLAALAVMLGVNWHSCDYSSYYFARDYSNNIFQSMKKDAIVFPIGDHQTFPIVYYQAVEGTRPDVLIGDIYGYLENDVLREYEKATGRSPLGLSRDEIEKGLILHSKRPLYFFRYVQPVAGPEKHVAIPMGVCYEITTDSDARSTGTLARQDAVWKSFSFRGVEDPKAFKDEMALSICEAYSFMKGELLITRGDLGGALAEYDKGIAASGDSAESLNNVAATLAERGFREQAKDCFYRSLTRSPGYKQARMNLANMLMEEGNLAEALEQYRIALRFNPGDQELRNALRTLVERMKQQEAGQPGQKP